MSLSQKNFYAIGDVNLTSMMASMDIQRRAKQAISLTHYDDNLEPKIAAGSTFELGGALFGCDADESITGWAGIGNDEDVYVKLVPSGATATAEFTTDIPTWSTSKQGWYVGNDRYIGGLYKDGSGNYYNKYLMGHQVGFVSGLGFKKHLLADVFIREKVLEIGDWDMNVDYTHNVSHGLTIAQIISVSVTIINDAGTSIFPFPLGSYSSSAADLVGGVASLNVTNVVLMRKDGCGFDSVSFETPPGGNRGWVYIKYRA